VRRLGLDETTTGQASLLATEAATNVIRHGGHRRAAVPPLPSAPGVEIVTLDRGPGIADVARAMEDGHSTRARPATVSVRCGGCRPPSTSTAARAGTAVLMRLGPPSRIALGVVNLPYPGETECGDAWQLEERPYGFRLVVVDGLGHGRRRGSRRCGRWRRRAGTRVARARAGGGARRLAERPRLGHRGGRGGPPAARDPYAGIGNVAAQILEPGTSRSLSLDERHRRSRHRAHPPFTYPFASGAVLVMFSDGLASRWSLEHQPGCWPAIRRLIAGVLYRDTRAAGTT
jgi:hypothetical protein